MPRRRAPIAAAARTDAQTKALHADIAGLYRWSISANSTRKLDQMQLKSNVGDELLAAYALAEAEEVAVMVGFKVPVPDGQGGHYGVQETDGPLGAAAIALASLQTKKPISVICDRHTRTLVTACLKELGGDGAASAVRFHVYESGPATHVAQRRQEIADSLTQGGRQPLLVAIETTGRTEQGVSRSMRGIDITSFNSDFDGLARQLGARGLKLLAIGDGGNELGMGAVTGVPLATNGLPMQAQVEADYVVKATVSNWGGYFLYAVLKSISGQTHDIPTPEQHDNAVGAMLKLGAVDGFTLRSDPAYVNDAGRPTAVDGLSLAVNRKIWEDCVAFVRKEARDVPHTFGKSLAWEENVTIQLFDSSDGALYALRTTLPYLEAQLPGNKTYVAWMDHERAPYGSKTKEELKEPVAALFDAASQLSDAPVMLACNTVSVVLMALESEGHSINAINLVANTARFIARGIQSGRRSFAMLMTPGMAKSGIYARLVASIAGDLGISGQWSANTVPCERLADDVNRGYHCSPDPEERRRVFDAIVEYLAPLPRDLQCLYLCCTHYPALIDLITEAYTQLREKAGITDRFEVIDPMREQAIQAVDQLRSGDFKHAPLDESDREAAKVELITTGPVGPVQESAYRILGKSVPYRVRHVSELAAFNTVLAKGGALD